MSVTVTPSLVVAGLDVLTSPAASSLYAVDSLRISWGRSTVLEQPTPATASCVLFDRSWRGTGFAARGDLIGQPLVSGYHGVGGVVNENFRGRITDVQVEPLTGAAGGGFRISLAASSVEVDLANIKVPAGTVWGAESFNNRAARLAALLPSYGFAGGIQLPRKVDLGLSPALMPTAELGALVAAQQDVGGKSVLELLRQVFASLAPLPMVYQPIAQRIAAPTRRRYTYNSTTGVTASARLAAVADLAGRYAAVSLTGDAYLDGAALRYEGALTQPIDARITRVEVSYLDGNVTPAYDTRVATADTADTPLEGTIGRRVLTIDTNLANAAAATQLAGIYADVANREARTHRLGVLGYSTARQPLADILSAGGLIGGYETPATYFLQRSWLPWLGKNPQVGNIGGTISYRGGAAPRWDVDFIPAPVIVDPAPYAWAPVPLSAAAVDRTVLLRHLDPSLTFGDMAFIDVGAGRTASTAVPYKGNPA